MGKKSVKIQEIAGHHVSGDGCSTMAGYVSALKDNFLEGSEPIKKNLQVLSDGTIYIKSRCGWISPWDGKPKYESWYA